MAEPTYFDLFALPLHLTLDTAALERQFYALSRRLHPDRFAARPAAEQESALAAASHLNDAYRTLRDPVARTQYLLHLEGVELEEQSKSATDQARATGAEKKQSIPPELLEEVFELNMQLAEMRAARQMGEDEPGLRADLESARTGFESRMQQTQAELEALWLQWDRAVDGKDDPARTDARDRMVALLNKRTYLRNLLRDVTGAIEA